MKTRLGIGVVLLLVVVGSLVVRWRPTTAQEKPALPTAAFECRWANTPPTIDGVGDDATWKDAATIDHFYLPWLGKKARKAKTATRAKLLWDREYLYFLADMDDADLYADVTEHNGPTWDNDVFELFFKPDRAKGGYYEFQVNALGTSLEIFIPQRGSGKLQPFTAESQFHLAAKVKTRGTLNKWSDKDEGWTVEGRIPWTDFMKTGGRPDVDERWQFALCRYDYSVEFEGPELSTCAPLGSKTFPDFHAHEDYATLQFMGPTKAQAPKGALTQRHPLTTSKVVGSPEPPPPYRVERVYPNLTLNFPVAVAHVPGSDQLFILNEERAYGDTVLNRMKDDATTKAISPVLTFKGVAYDVTFHPQFVKNGYFYVGWNGIGGNGKKHSKVTRWTMQTQAPWNIDQASEQLILEWESDGHNGAALAFGKDGMLYITSGDGTSDSDTNVTGQKMDVLLGKLLRIDVDHPEPGKTYSVPTDNPFIGKAGVRPETWAYGLRNPWRLHCDSKTGHLWIGNNGQDLWEQIYFARKGDNYGWSVFEGSHSFYPERKLGPTPHVKPTFEHHHSEARSLTGGLVYYGKKYPDLVGAYIYGDYSTGRIWAGKHDGTKVVWHREIAQTRLQIAGFGTDAQGEILIADHHGDGKGGLYTLVPSPKETGPNTFPKRVSDSGLFASVKEHRMQPGVIPYSVNAPFWSDGAYKERWLAIPAQGKIDYKRNRGWGFPDQTVIVKSFALETEEGNPNTRRWIETRLLTKQGHEWSGYTYRWNDEQTDATLVESKGLDVDFSIKSTKGDRTQRWHYPSRSECMVCHSRAAEWVLGLCEVQMNKSHDYGTCTENQLVVFERLGLFNKINYSQHVREIFTNELEQQGLPEAKIKEAVAARLATRNQREATNGDMLPFGPERYRRLVDPYDVKADLNLRARSFLHSNCASCHVEAGGGNALMELEFITKADKMRLFDVKPVHSTFGLPDARLVAPGAPERSVLLHRISHRNQGHMPPLATYRVDEAALEMLRTWIKQMPPAPKPK